MTRVLITNDDGIDAPGLHALARMAVGRGFDVVVAAPSQDASGSSAALLTASGGHIVTSARVVPGLPDIPAYAVDASPAMIALIASRGAFGDPPEAVFSGINRGFNIGRAVLHSGTVGAALTAAGQGCRAMAVSLACTGVAGDPDWDAAARVAADLVPRLLGAPVETVFNLNVPDGPYGSMPGAVDAGLASFGAVQTKVESGDGYVRLTIADVDEQPEPGTDAAWLARGYPSVTPLRPVLAAGPGAGSARRGSPVVRR
jgi:5'-nucleotidase